MVSSIRIFRMPGSPTDPTLPKLQAIGFTDNFNRPNSSTTLGSTNNGVAWESLGGIWGVQDGAARVVSGTGNLLAVTQSRVADGVLTGVVKTAEDYAGFAFRVVDEANRLFVNRFGSALRLYKRVGGTSTMIAEAPAQAIMDGDTITATLSGQSVVVRRNGVSVITATVPEFVLATKHGILGGAGGGAFRVDSLKFEAA